MPHVTWHPGIVIYPRNELSRAISKGQFVLGDGIVFEVVDDYHPGPRRGVPVWSRTSGLPLHPGREQDIPEVASEIYDLVSLTA